MPRWGSFIWKRMDVWPVSVGKQQAGLTYYLFATIYPIRVFVKLVHLLKPTPWLGKADTNKNPHSSKTVVLNFPNIWPLEFMWQPPNIESCCYFITNFASYRIVHHHHHHLPHPHRRQQHTGWVRTTAVKEFNKLVQACNPNAWKGLRQHRLKFRTAWST